MSFCEQYRSKIEDILRGSDLSAITTKFVRRSLEKQIGASLDPMKKEINEFIEEIFVDFSEKEEERTKRYLELVVKKEEEKAKLDVPTKAEKAVASTKAATVKKEKGNKVEKKNAAAPKKKKKEKEPGEKRVIDWPVYTILPPMSDIIGTQLCTRPATVKKLWEYIRSHNLQDPNKKSIIRCDDKFRKLCDGASTCSPFNMNKYTQPYFEKIEKEDQPKFKAIFKQQEGLNTVKSEESSN